MVAVLNIDYSYLQAVSDETACVLLYKGTVVPASTKILRTFRSINSSIDVPIAIRVLHYVNPRRRRGLRFTKKRVYARDNYICQYSGKKLRPSDATIDHILPKSRGGKSTFENCVTCSRDINIKKGDRTPDEAGLKLIHVPRPYVLREWDKLMQLGLLI